MATAKIATQIRLDQTAHKKCKYISTKELRSLNSQMEYFILKGIEEFEEKNGVIPLDED